MNVVVLVACFATALWATAQRGAGFALAAVYLPSLLLLSHTQQVSLPGLTDASAPIAALYGLIVGGLATWRTPRLRLLPVDAVVALLLLTYIVSGAVVDYPYKGISLLGTMTLNFGFLPYFVVRASWWDRRTMRTALLVMVATVLVVLIFALIELRLRPRTYMFLLHKLDLTPNPAFMIERRFGLFRANASFIHYIDLGNSAALLFAMIAICAWRVRAMSKLWVRGALLAALIASLCGMSFTSILGLAVGLGLYVVLVNVRLARRLLPWMVCIAIATGTALTIRMAYAPFRPPSEADSILVGSYLMRQSIVQRVWDAVRSAGVLGWGDRSGQRIEAARGVTDMLGAISVDNAYLLFVVSRGWAVLLLWLAIPVALSLLVSRAAARARAPVDRKMLLAGFSAVAGTMVSMYTVWFGFVYAPLFMIVLALTVNAAQANLAMARRNPAPRPAASVAPRAAVAGSR